MSTMLPKNAIDYLCSEVTKLRKNSLVFCAGVYKGGDVCRMAQARPDLRFFVVDSFMGLWKPREEDLCEHTALGGECDPGGMMPFIENTRNARVIAMVKAWITNDIADMLSSVIMSADMIWLDLDHYEPTNAILRVASENETAVILTHDYGFRRCPGIKRACDKYGTWEVECQTIAKLARS